MQIVGHAELERTVVGQKDEWEPSVSLPTFIVQVARMTSLIESLSLYLSLNSGDVVAEYIYGHNHRCY